MSSPQISVILPTYNDANYLEEAIDSILNQTYEYFELLVIDDGSTDHTSSIVKGYADKRIRYFKFAINRGIVAGLNHGLDNAKGRYIARMDGDDISEPTRLEEQVHFMERNKEIGICGTGLTKFNNRQLNEYSIPCNTKENVRPFGLFATPINHPTCMIRKDLLNQYNIRYTEGFLAAEDYLFILQVLKYTEAHIIPKSLYKYRIHQSNTSIKERAKQLHSCQEISYLAFRDNFGDSFSKKEHTILFNLFHNILTHSEDDSMVEQSVIKFLDAIKEHTKFTPQPLTKMFTLKLLKHYHQHNDKITAILYLIKSGVWLKNTPKELINGLFKQVRMYGRQTQMTL